MLKNIFHQKIYYINLIDLKKSNGLIKRANYKFKKSALFLYAIKGGDATYKIIF